MRLLLAFYPLALSFLAYEGSSEVYTALAQMERLTTADGFLVKLLNDYIMWAERNLMELKSHFARFHSQHHDMVKKGVEKYLSNPINAYLLTKRLTVDWWVVSSMVANSGGQRLLSIFEDYLYQHKMPWPTSDDLRGAAMGITRLQRTYDLKTSNVAEGEIKGISKSNRFSSADCFELGVQAHQFLDYEYSEQWLMEAFQRHHEEFNKTTSLVDILEFLSYIAYLQGDLKRALTITKKILKVDALHMNAITNLDIYQKMVQESIWHNETGVEPTTNESNTMNPRKKYIVHEFGKHCRCEKSISEEKKAKLRCRYVDFGNPFLILAKLKEEEIFLNPRIVVFHDVIYDNEIETIQRLAFPRFERATVVGEKKKGRDVVDARTGQLAWLHDEEHPQIEIISRRVQDMTGLNMKASEALQVVNYGIGGHYFPHLDFTTEEETTPALEKFGNRVATVLIYLNTVPQGGGTTFPLLNLTVSAVKGTALIWYNMFRSGALDYRTMHGACPVLEGSKWICTKWIRERGQEFTRPCQTFKDEKLIEN